MFQRLSIALLLAVGASIPSLAIAATDNSGLYAAANQYRNAVVEFERVVNSVRGIQRTDERLVDKLEEATKKLRLAAKNPRHANRLRYEWRNIQPLQQQVESVIFGKYTLHHELVHAWDAVLYFQALFENEFVYQLGNPRHGNTVQRRINTSNPGRFLPPPPASTGRLYLQPDDFNR